MSRKKGSRLSVRSRYRLTMAVLLLTMLAATLVSGTMNYQSQYADRLESARNDFETAWREVFSFMNRISGLAKIVQYNSSLVQMLEKTERYTSEDYQKARTDLIPMIYSLEDGSGDYTCRIYIRSTLPVLDPSSHVLPMSDLEGQPWAETAMRGFGTIRWEASGDRGEEAAVFLSPIRSLDHKSDLIALLRIDVRSRAILDRMSLVKSRDYACCQLLTPDGSSVLSAGSERAAEFTSPEGAEDWSLDAYRWNEKKTEQGTAFYRRLDCNDWLLTMTVRRDLLRGLILPNDLIIHAASMLLFILGSLLAAPLLWRVIARIETFSEHVQAYNGPQIPPKLPEALEPGEMDEVGRLIDAHNEMVARINRLMQEREIQEEESRRLEIQALQNQINPHFLYNSLDAVRWMARLEQPDQIENLIQNLSDFYRLCLSSGQDVLTVSQEVEICRHYFSIMCLRNHKDYQLEISLPKEINDLKLPKITLQPLVENAIVHGLLESGQTEGTVWINGWRKDGRDYISVEDSGGRFRMEDWQRILYGEDGEKKKRLKEGYGLWNVERRLCLFYRREQVMYLKQSGQGRTAIEWELTRVTG